MTMSREEYDQKVAELADKVEADISSFKKMFDASAEGMIRMMLLMWFLKKTLPDIFNHVDDAGAMAGVWLTMGSPECEEQVTIEMLRRLEGIKH